MGGRWWLAALACLAVFLGTQYGYALWNPFINDDYIFLDRVRDASFASLWRLDRPLFHWWRPWSRELHYWTLQHLAGAREPAFHAASFALWLAILALYLGLARRLAGPRVAAVATAGAAALGAWGVPLVWVAGVQDLWMLCGALLALHAAARDRWGLAAAGVALALLSKETAAVVPAIVLCWPLIVERRPPRDVLRRAWPVLAVCVAWVIVHPSLGGRVWQPRLAPPGGPGEIGHSAAFVLWRTARMLVNLDLVPRPADGWGGAIGRAWPGALALAGLVAWGAMSESRPSSKPAAPAAPAPTVPPRARVAAFGLAWAVLGILPLLSPWIRWHPYYGLLGALGAWLAIAVFVARFWIPAAVLVAALAILRGGQAYTPWLDWWTEWLEHRAGYFLGVMRDDLRRHVPSPPPHSRFYFVQVPSHAGFLTEGAPALRIWYGDSTLTGGFFRDYTPPPANRVSGVDRFFRYDSLAGWIELAPGDTTIPPAPDERWSRDVHELGRTFARASDWGRAASEYERLARAHPDDAGQALEAGVARALAGDVGRAMEWLARAGANPAASDSVRAMTRDLMHQLRPDASRPGGH